MKKKFLVILKIAFVIFTAYVITATSRGTNSPVLNKIWGVSTNCPNATANNETMTVGNDGIIVDPTNRSFIDYGLPVSSMRIGTDNYVGGSVNNIVRECTHSSSLDGTSGKTLHIYACMEIGIAVCVITFTPQ